MHEREAAGTKPFLPVAAFPPRPLPPGPSPLRPALVALLAGLGMFVAGTSVETGIIEAFQGNRPALEWISDAVISAAVAGLAYLWLHLKQSRSRLLDVERAGIVIAEQLRMAAAIQRNLLPAVPPRTPGFEWAARMVPAGQIGGDFYDFLETGDGMAIVFMGDISGKGIPAALLHASLRAAFRLVALDTRDPVPIATRIGDVLHSQTGGVPYATAIVACFDGPARRLTYVNAGHPPGHLIGPDRPLLLEAGGPPLGMFPEATYRSAHVNLGAGDVGVLVTDGITEAVEATTSVPDLLHGRRHDLRERASPAEVCDLLLAAAARGIGPAGAGDWHDDATALVFRAV